ncbi:MAG: hypothetical protein HY074_10780 [Deltaproteobacteria bacterium]|nr:hypothetical protein [Deltaproteobacteria bacterium]
MRTFNRLSTSLFLIGGLASVVTFATGCVEPMAPVAIHNIQIHASIIRSTVSPNPDPSYNNIGNIQIIYTAPNDGNLSYDSDQDSTNPGKGLTVAGGQANALFSVPARTDDNGDSVYPIAKDFSPELLLFNDDYLLLAAAPDPANPPSILGNTLRVNVIFDIDHPEQDTPAWQLATLLLKHFTKDPFGNASKDRALVATEELRDAARKATNAIASPVNHGSDSKMRAL